MGRLTQDLTLQFNCVYLQRKSQGAGCSLAQPKQQQATLASSNMEKSSCPMHSTLRAPEFLLNSQTSTFLLNHDGLKKKE